MTEIENEKKVITTRAANIVCRCNSFTEVHFKAFSTVNREDIKDILLNFCKSNNNEPATVLTYISNTTIFQESAREYYLFTLNKRFKKAEAIITESLAQYFGLISYLKESNPQIPVKVFTDRDEGIAWLSQYL